MNALARAVGSRSQAKAILDAYAHELAERIRAEAATGDLNAGEYGTHENVLDAADLIDPRSSPA